MSAEIGYNVSGVCGSTIIFGLTDDGVMYADLGGDIYEDEEYLEGFATDCDTTLEKIRSDLECESVGKSPSSISTHKPAKKKQHRRR